MVFKRNYGVYSKGWRPCWRAYTVRCYHQTNNKYKFPISMILYYIVVKWINNKY